MSIVSGYDLCVLLFRVSASVFSVFFRVRPWQMLLLLPLLILISVAYSASAYFRVFPCSSVANASASALPSFRGLFCFCLFPCFSVKFRVNPWQMLLLNSVAHASCSERYVAFVFPKPNSYRGLR